MDNPVQEAAGSKEGHPFGLHDMSGNVREWCLDGFGSYRDWDKSAVIQAHLNLSRVCRGGAYTLRSELAVSPLRALV